MLIEAGNIEKDAFEDLLGAHEVGQDLLDEILEDMDEYGEEEEAIDTDGAVIFVGPVWMGQTATPLRAAYKQLKTKLIGMSLSP